MNEVLSVVQALLFPPLAIISTNQLWAFPVAESTNAQNNVQRH
jgi:hypothetical protein